MKRVILILIVMILTITPIGCSPIVEESAELLEGNNQVENENTEPRILRVDEQNLGYPSIYTVSPRGRGYLLMSLIFDTLTWKDENGVTAMLAKDWIVSDNNLEWTFNLVENANFTDGTKLTAVDVKFSFEYMMKHPHQWVNLNMVEKVEILDQHQVKIFLKEVYAPFITDVAGNVPIMPKHIWEKIDEPQKFNTDEAVIGSGPFTLAKYDIDAGSYIFEANEDYFLGKPVIDQLILSPNNQPALSLKNGELDAAQRLSYGEAMELKREGQFKVIEGPGLWVYRMYFNFDIPEFNQKELRQAIYYGINRNEIVEKALKKAGIPGNPGHIHPDSDWYSDVVKEYTYDPDKAKDLINQAGLSDKALEYELLVTDDRVDEAEMMKKYLGDIGISISVKAMDQKSVDSLISEGKFQLALNGHGSFGGDPVLLARFIGEGVNLGSTPTVTAQGGKKWSNEIFDDLFLKQLKETDYQKRYKIVAELQNIIAEELPTLTLYYRKITFAYNTEKLNGWYYTKDGVAIAVPTTQNKLIYINGTWGNQ
ncbi:ABC transporter substrate-binding protein [Alkaliphilus peptidifermentans]|uniref:Peptide/nickel transport system substrate-binding protein n=1 Tax=Alkaliphilus peptidifermentans DSM 18978 TaxID=1120976 RepID=A0A1G5JLA9_9FIRM|nr:ABC transporter substrate-binding protein [Alkaliphilus peptidifermentans]SCY88954.1 peptide/nickel transport system substrate-binding protein [Alkaliphilus peptidifermentans DSM 18978]